MADIHPGTRVHMATLNECCQRRQAKLEYKDIDASGPPHDRIFTVAVVIDGIEYSQGTGKSKKDARGCAAELALKRLQQEGQAAAPPRPVLEPLPPAFFPAAAPARQVQEPPPPQPLPLPDPLANLLQVSPAQTIDYVSCLNVYSLKNKLDVKYDFVDRVGMPHLLTFSCACRINGKIFPTGTGNSKKTAKSEAARLAYEEITKPATSTTGSAASMNSPENPALTENLEVPKEASMESVPDSSGAASKTSDSIVFMSSGIYSNDWDSEQKSNDDKLVDHTSAMQLNGTFSSSSASSKSPAVKSKRKELPLAPAFSKPSQRKSIYTVDERFPSGFKDIERISSGGFGTVFKAKHCIDEKFYAVKQIQLTHFEEEHAKREVKALANLRHDNIVQYFDCWYGTDVISAENSMSDEGYSCSSAKSAVCTDFQRSVRQDNQFKCLFIMMEYCEKGTLENWIQTENGRENYKVDAKRKFQQIAEGVKYIHSQNLIHRDLKPKNILISADDKIKIGDFGLVTTGIDDRLMERTRNIGTELYMAPEQAQVKYGKEVDIFPLGLILFEMLYVCKTHHEKVKMFKGIKEGKFPETFCTMHSSEIPLIKELLSKDPSHRPSADYILKKLMDQLYRPHTV